MSKEAAPRKNCEVGLGSIFVTFLEASAPERVPCLVEASHRLDFLIELLVVTHEYRYVLVIPLR